MTRKRVTTKRASYLEGVEWIALNDNSGSNDGVGEIAGYVSTLLLADLFGAEPERVAIDIERKRYAYLKSLESGGAK